MATIITRKAPSMCTICSVLHHSVEVELTKEKKSMFEWFTKKKKIQNLEESIENLRSFVINRQRANEIDEILNLILDVLGIKVIWSTPDEEEAATLKKGNYKLLEKIGSKKFYIKASSSEGKR